MKYLLTLSILFSSFAYANTKTETSFCDEAVAGEIIKFLEKEEPDADLHILVNQQDQVVGITDANDLFPTLDFVNTRKVGKNRYVNHFQYDTLIVYAEYFLMAPNGLPSCKVINTGMAQDDQD